MPAADGHWRRGARHRHGTFVAIALCNGQRARIIHAVVAVRNGQCARNTQVAVGGSVGVGGSADVGVGSHTRSTFMFGFRT